ncbi:alpha/beta hydrolase [Sphingomonas rosea]|uniref:Alpha/beta hydrolase n=1 Tax=Sphingomonas rosea TaxID=335605 RepID=A0ABP7TXI5_9SPHN
MLRLFLLPLCAFALVAARTAPAPIATPIRLGTSFAVRSPELGDVRAVNVVLPASYAKERTRRYPVLYLIDGGVEQDLLHIAGVVQLGGIWGRSDEAIVVGIETRDRRRELVGATADAALIKKYPTAGDSARFRAFLRERVKPLVERHYRTNGQSVLLGESLAGLFAVETYLAEPALFTGYGAIDPSLWWDKEALSLTAKARLGDAQRGRRLFLAFAREQSEEPAAMRRLVEGLKARGLPFCLAARPQLAHATIYQQSSPEALQYLLPAKEAPAPEFGFTVRCAPGM